MNSTPLLYIPGDWLKHEKIIRNTVPVKVESCRAGLVSNKALSLVIDADVPPAWPLLSLDRDTVSEFLVLLHSPERRGISAIHW